MRLFSDMLTWIIWQAESTCFSVSLPSLLSIAVHLLILSSFSLGFILPRWLKIWISPQNSISFSEPSSLNNLGLSGFLCLRLSLCALRASSPFIDFLRFNYIHAFCVGSLLLRLCIWGWGRNAGSRQTDFWWEVGSQEEAEKWHMKFLKLFLLLSLRLFSP